MADRAWDDVERMLSVDQALAQILAVISPLAAEEVDLLDTDGLVLAESIVATEDLPPYRNSAMDGYAIQARDSHAANSGRPRELAVVGSIAAGDVPTVEVTSGTAVRIMTGAAMPDGADSVARFEEVRFRPEDEDQARPKTILIGRATVHGENVRYAGEDVARGTTVLRPGTRLRPGEIGLLAALNRVSVAVHRRPRVAILSTGDELVDLGQPLAPGKIRNSNSYTLAAMAKRFGAIPHVLGIARDAVGDLTRQLEIARGCDLIVTSGGVSVGDYDLVKDVLRAEGEISIWQVRMKPGKPLAFGQVGGCPLLGLPGNPVAAAVSFEIFGHQVIAKMLGQRRYRPPVVTAMLTEQLDNRGQRRHYVRATVEETAAGETTVRVAGAQGAGTLSSLARANGLLVIPEELTVAEPGMRLPVLMLD